ncbi:ornithine cyclodeaminase family protein [Alsobacter soli]|uniref:Ornithine cyclodeaminase family protein n=1 Tax=Alsobacter soli TaxID=2109933 RepID=A0A2T1HRG1_9HYPH|nr:ornithine cyclodeaminase family protein [Alsobacter soli]PSC04212.1 ornithine cyclodeaminase family protein [Alsobacter soli]
MRSVPHVEAEEVHRLLPFETLVPGLLAAHRTALPVAERLLMSQPGQHGETDHFLLWPAWKPGRALGIKLVTVFPGNAHAGKPAIGGLYVLFDGQDGQPLCVIDGAALTFRKTAADSAAGASLLARPDARRLAMLGAGGQAIWQVRAMAAVRPITHVAVWNRTLSKARALADALRREGLDATATEHEEGAVADADIVCCAAASRVPVLRGAWLRPGTHVDLVGSYTPEMREADDEAVRRARVFVDTRRFTLAEAGDIAQPIAAGVVGPEHVLGDLFQLAHGVVQGRTGPDDVTLYKNAGGGHLDLICAELLHRRLRPGA